MRSVWPAVLSVLIACGTPAPSEVHEVAGGRHCPAAAGTERSTSGTFGGEAGEPLRALVLMGGSAEVDAAARRFVEAAGGGDVLVLRASGSTTSYNPYFLADLSPEPAPSSVTTIRIDEPVASSSAGVLCMVANAEAVWLAGGDQWNYVGRWDASLHGALQALIERGVAIGGTSAGAVVLGEAAFDAELGTVTSAEALADPLRPGVSVSLSPLGQPELAGWIVDSHFSERGREGRLLAFLARMLPLTGRDTVYGAGLDERAALVIADGTYATLASAGRSAWLYRLVAPVELVAGEPLDGVEASRLRLSDSASGAWPPSFADADTVRVTGGVVENGI